MADNVIHSLAIDQVLRVSNFTHKSLSVFVDGGTFSVQVSNDGIKFFSIQSSISADVLIRTGPAATDLPHQVEFIKVVEEGAGTAPRFFLSAHNPV